MANYQETCECCGNMVTAYIHHLNSPLVSALRQLVDFYEKTSIPANLQNNLSLTKNQYNNFQKLQYFGLVHRTKDGWYPTPLGNEFITGRIDIPVRVATLGKTILPEHHEVWSEAKVKPAKMFVWEIDEGSYKKRPEYQAEKSMQETLFRVPPIRH